MENRKRKLITHNGSFHTDDLFAAATLVLVMERQGTPYEIIRTRDMEVIKNADYVFDVGGIYDPNTNRYDHHQKNGSGKRENGIPYASFGLVWKHFGLDLCEGNQDVWQIIDKEIASPIDASDNGVDLVSLKFKNITPYGGGRVFNIFEPTWKEKENNIDEIFKTEVGKVSLLLKREIKVATDDVEGIKIIKDRYHKSKNKQIIILEESLPRYLYQNTLCDFKEPIYVIMPSAHGSSFKVEAIKKNRETFESRKAFPKNWRGYLNSDTKPFEYDDLSGVLFVHNSGFLANVDTKENAILFAEKALNYKEGFKFKNLFKN